MLPSSRRVARRYASGLSVDMSRYKAELHRRLRQFIDHQQEAVQTAPRLEDLRERAEKYLPGALTSRMRPGEGRWLPEVYKALKEIWDTNYDDEVFALMRLLMKWDASQEDPASAPLEAARTEKTILERVESQMVEISHGVQQAVGRAHNWGGSRVSLSPEFADSTFDRLVDEKPLVGVVQLALGKNLSATFFVDGTKIEGIDDVLEGGDADFFDDPQEQADYFSLINEIRKPGSSSQGHRVVLWTARPSRDRRRYEGARTVPANIFLTNDPDRAAGLAHDLGSGVRDLWRVVMNSRDLVQTLAAGAVRDYQTIAEAPVQDIQLFSEGS